MWPAIAPIRIELGRDGRAGEARSSRAAARRSPTLAPSPSTTGPVRRTPAPIWTSRARSRPAPRSRRPSGSAAAPATTTPGETSLALDLQAQLPAQRVEGALAQLGERADVVPVLADLVDVERHVVLEQRREHVLGPVDERALGEVVEDLRLEHVDAAVAEVRERLVRAGLLLKAGDAPVAVVQHDAVLARVGHLLDGQRRDPAGLAVALAASAVRSMSVSASPEITRNELVAEELRARAHAAGGAEQLRLVAVGQALAEVLADRVGEVVQVGDRLAQARGGRAGRGCAPSPAGRAPAPSAW